MEVDSAKAKAIPQQQLNNAEDSRVAQGRIGQDDAWKERQFDVSWQRYRAANHTTDE